jgi:putative glutamine amidotransferase
VVETVTGATLLHTASRHYVECVVRAGGLPVVLPVVDPDDVAGTLAVVHGLLVTGGGDVAPSRYKAQPTADTRGVDPARDAFDFALLHEAIRTEVPVLATCRGMQVLNVALGGSLVQHVPTATGHNHDHIHDWHQGSHPVKIEPDSHLAEALGSTELVVNSLHHQAVLEPAPGTRAVAWAEDGTVEAVELPGSPHVVAVQWHPELLEDYPEQQGLFRQLVEQAAEVAKARRPPAGG